MIEFLSLFVGLVVGVHDVEVTVSGPVARGGNTCGEQAPRALARAQLLLA